MLEKFAKLPDSWPLGWSKKGRDTTAFDNCYWLRNPGVSQKYFVRENNGIESLKTTDDEAVRILEIKEMHAKTPEVLTHFKTPEAAWNAVMTANDGGVTYIINELALVCQPEIKKDQLDNLAGSLSRELASSMRDFYIPTDAKKRQEVNKSKFLKFSEEINVITSQNRFANLLEEFYLSEDYLKKWSEKNTSTHVVEVLDGVCDEWQVVAKLAAKRVCKEYPISKPSVEFFINELRVSFTVADLQNSIVEKAAFLDGMEGNRKLLSLAISALMINDFISAADQVVEQDPQNIILSETRDNIAKNFSSRWLSNFEKLIDKNISNLDGDVSDPKLNQEIGELIDRLELLDG